MAVWRLSSLGRVSSLTGEPFPPDTEVVTALFGDDEEAGDDRVRGAGFVRRDYRADEVTPEHLEGAYCTWRTRTAPPKPARRAFDLGMARDFLLRMLGEAREDRDPVCLALALLLMRKRRLKLVRQGAGWLEVRWPRETKTFRVPSPDLTEAEVEALEQELLRMFDL